MTKRTTMTIASVVGVFAAVFTLHHDWLGAGFYADDLDHIKHIPPFSLTQLPHLLNPYRGWFYRPVYLIYFSLVLRAFGANAVAFHAASLVLHGVNTCLLIWLVRRLSDNVFIAGACGLAFLLYPRKDEAVWWIAANSTLLASCFYLLTLHGWLSWRQRPRWWVYAASLLCFFVALCSKEDALSLPLALLIFDLLQGPRETWGRRLKQYLPFLLVVIGYLALDALAYHHYVTLSPHEAKLSQFTPVVRLRIVIKFVNRMFLGIFGLDPLALTVLCFGIVTWAMRRDRLLLSLWLWALAAALPAPLAAGTHGMVSRFYYLPALAVTAFLTTLIAQWLSSGQKEKQLGALLWIAALAAYLAPVRIREPGVVWGVLYGTLAISFIVYRARLIDLPILLTVGIFALFTQLDIYAPLGGTLFWRMIALALCAIALRTYGWWQSILATAFLWFMPAVTLPTLVGGMVGLRRLSLKKQGKSLVCHSERSEESQNCMERRDSSLRSE